MHAVQLAPMPRRRARSLVLALVAMSSAACAQQGPPGVGIEAVAADVIFGVPAAVEAVPISSAPPPSFIPPVVTVPSSPTPNGPFGPPPLPPEPPVQACPVASINAFPEEPAFRNVPDGRLPDEGVFRWRTKGTTRSEETLLLPFPVLTIGEMSIREVARVDDTTFTWVMVTLDGAGNTVERTWQVRTAATTIGPGGLPVTVPGAEAVPTVGDPDRGLALAKVRYLDPDGNELSSFEPATPLLVMPLPVMVGEQFTSQAVDTTNFSTWAFANAEVQPAERVDACGQIIEGFAVTGTLTYTDSAGATQATNEGGYHLVVAPQLGGIIVLEGTSIGAEGGPGRDIVEHLGPRLRDLDEVAS